MAIVALINDALKAESVVWHAKERVKKVIDNLVPHILHHCLAARRVIDPSPSIVVVIR